MQAFIILLITTFSFFSVRSSNLNIIRDAETENFLKEISYILIEDNKLELNNLNFFIDNKDFINAFVIPGQKIFLTKGLLMKSKKIEDLAGVIAHEIGHIVLHSDGNSKSFNRKIEGCNDDFKAVKKDPIEVQADMFAASLLMPSEAVIKSFYNAYITPINVSKRSFSEYIFPRSKKSKMFRAVNRIQSLGSFQNVSKTALINRLIGLRLLKGIDFQKNKIKEY